MVEMEGVDIYNPVENTILPTEGGQGGGLVPRRRLRRPDVLHHPGVLPRPDRLGKLAQALKGVIDEEAFAASAARRRCPSRRAPHKRVAVKVIDPRGNEVMRVHRLDGVGYEARAHA